MGDRRVAIAGVALSDCGRVPEKTRLQLIHQASQAALADAGLTHTDVEGFGSVGTVLPPTDVSAWCQAMLQIARDEKLRLEMAAKSIARAKLFSWERFIAATIHGYRTSLEFKD